MERRYLYAAIAGLGFLVLVLGGTTLFMFGQQSTKSAANLPVAEGVEDALSEEAIIGRLGPNYFPSEASNADAKLMEQAAVEEVNCRGGSGDSAQTMAACDRRDSAFDRVIERGWCRGKDGEANVDYTWHACTPTSIGFEIFDRANRAAKARLSVLTINGAGDLSLGASRRSVDEKYSVTLVAEGEGCSLSRLQPGGLSVMFVDDRLVRIAGIEGVRTQNGVGIGSRMDQMQAAFGAPDSSEAFDPQGGPGPTRLLTYRFGERYLTFGIDAGGKVVVVRAGMTSRECEFL